MENSKHISGDLSVGRNTNIGGSANIQGNATIGHNLKVKGWVEAPNIKDINKGVFVSYQELLVHYPTPNDGWLAGVVETITDDVSQETTTQITAYLGIGGQWVKQDFTLDVNMDVEQLKLQESNLFVNVTNLFELVEDKTLSEILELIDGMEETVAALYKVPGVVLTFLGGNGWETWRWDGESPEDWNDESTWVDVDAERLGKFATGEKVNEVGIDSTPTPGSDNLVESGGVYILVNSEKERAFLAEQELQKNIDVIKDETLEENRQMITSIMDNYKPVEVIGDVTNSPDEEDITSINVQGTNVLKLKDKAHNPLVFSGLGKKYIRKNIINSNNIFTQQMMPVETGQNTKYIIQYDYDLNGQEITVPEGCTIVFDGGSFSNGSLVLQNTFIEGKNGFNPTVSLSGTCANDTLYSDIYKLDTTGTEECSTAIRSLFNVCKSTIIFAKGIYKFDGVNIEKDILVDGQFSTFKSATPLVSGHPAMKNVIKISNCNKAVIRNVCFEGNNVGTRDYTYDTESALWIKDVANVYVTNCTFCKQRGAKYNVPLGESEYNYLSQTLTITGFRYVEVKGCEFYENDWGEPIWITPSEYKYPSISEKSNFFTDNSTIIFTDNYYHNYKDDQVYGNSVANLMATNITILRNTIEYVTYNGSAINAFGSNITFNDNVIKNCHFRTACLDTCEYGYYFNDFVDVENNILEVRNGTGIVVNSKRAIIQGNSIKSMAGIIFYGVEQSTAYPRPTPELYVNYKPCGLGESVIIKNNNIDNNYYDPDWISDGNVILPTGMYAIRLNVSPETGKNVDIENNIINCDNIGDIVYTKRYPISITNFGGKINLVNNKIYTNIRSSVSSTTSIAFNIENTLQIEYDSIVCENNIVLSTDNTFVRNYILTCFTTSVSKAEDIVFNSNTFNGDKDVCIWLVKTIGNNFIIKNTKHNISESRFVAKNLDTDIVFNIKNIVTPKANTEYKLNTDNDNIFVSNLVGDSKNVTRTKYSTNVSDTESTYAASKTIYIGETLRIDNSTILVALENSAIPSTIPELPSSTTDNTVIDWNNKKWLCLKKNKLYTFSILALSNYPSSFSDYENGIFLDRTNRTLAGVVAGVRYDAKGWKYLGFKGDTTAMTGLSLFGSGDEGYLFFNTDVKLWCQFYIDRSNESSPLVCWQILGSGRGSTAKRPTVLTSRIGVGFQYYDTTLNKLIYWNGSSWIDAAGNNPDA